MKTKSEICSKLSIKKPERHHWRLSTSSFDNNDIIGVFVVNFQHISHLFLVLLLLTLNKKMLAGYVIWYYMCFGITCIFSWENQVQSYCFIFSVIVKTTNKAFYLLSNSLLSNKNRLLYFPRNNWVRQRKTKAYSICGAIFSCDDLRTF